MEICALTGYTLCLNVHKIIIIFFFFLVFSVKFTICFYSADSNLGQIQWNTVFLVPRSGVEGLTLL